MNANSVILAILALLLFIAIGAAISLLYLYLSLKSRIRRQANQERESWRESARKEAQDQLAKWREQVNQERESWRESARKEAQDQLTRWREQELDLAKRQQFELAHKEAQDQLARWREQANQERESWRESARKEAQDQLARWREQELDLAKKQQFELAHSEAILQLEKWKHEQEQVIRQDAVQRSQSVTIGKITEHLMPYLPGFSYNPKDVRFIGSPIDLIIFDGLNDGEVRKVILVEVKTGASKLSPRERRLRDAVQAGRVEWIEYRPSVDANSTGFEG